jgi:hypothetical protein
VQQQQLAAAGSSRQRSTRAQHQLLQYQRSTASAAATATLTVGVSSVFAPQAAEQRIRLRPIQQPPRQQQLGTSSSSRLEPKFYITPPCIIACKRVTSNRSAKLPYDCVAAVVYYEIEAQGLRKTKGNIFLVACSPDWLLLLLLWKASRQRCGAPER